MRLDALLSRFGYCSRREAASWIKSGRVQVNNETAASAKQKTEPADVLIDGEPIDFPDGLYIAFHKPVGCVCSHGETEGKQIYEYLPEQWLRRNPAIQSVGRLDKDTSGLLLLSDDGQFVHHHTSPKHHIPKTYEFETETDIPAEAVALFASGTLLLANETSPCKPAELTILAPRRGRLVLYEGRYHQVRRMLDHAGAHILSLHRISIGSLNLDELGIAPGEWVPVTPES